MIHRLFNFIYKYEGIIGIIGFIGSFFLMKLFEKNINIFTSFPIGISWLSVFLIGDYINKINKEGSIFPHRENQKNKFRNLIIAAFIMNLLLDLTGSWFMRLWYYPKYDPLIYLIFFAPIGYILYGLVLYVFYRFIKRKYDKNVQSGRMTNIKALVFKIIINMEILLGTIGFVLSLFNYSDFYQKLNIKWFEINLNSNIPVNVWNFIMVWISLFFILEFICHKLGRETLTRDIIRGNFIPLISIIFSSAICIVLVEFFNAPFQIWSFVNWPLGSIKLLNIPLMAYLIWPMQYLILLPLIRIFDGKNIENVW